jgi:hypothetical protein
VSFALAAVAAATCAGLLDYALARYNLALRDGHHHRAGVWSVAVALLAGFGVLALVGEPWILLPQCAGYYAGTRLGARAHERRQPEV